MTATLHPTSRPTASEHGAMLRLAWPLIAGNLAQIMLTTTDVLLIGRLGGISLASGALAASFYQAVSVFCAGLVMATTPLIAAALGRGSDPADLRAIIANGFLSGLLIGVPTWLLLGQTTMILIALGQAPEMAAGAGEMMNTLRWALFPYLVYIILRGVLAATGHARWTLGVLLAAILFNAAAGWALIFGHLGMPALGLAGAGMASALSSLGLAAGVIVILIRHPALASLRLLAGPRVTDPAGLVTIWRLGLPIAVAMAFEMGIFYAAMLMVGAVGPDALAAHAIAMQIVSICFMLPFGFGQAATVRVGHAFGARDALLAQRAAMSARMLGLAAVTVTSLATVIFPAIFLGLFVDADSPANAGIVETGSAMLRIAALFLFASATQTIAAGALRGLQDTRTPMLIAAAGYWGVGLPAALLFGFPLGYGGPGIWGGLTLGLAVVAVLMMLRWRRLVGRLAFQAA